jgi:hypothetical protein
MPGTPPPMIWLDVLPLSDALPMIMLAAAGSAPSTGVIDQTGDEIVTPGANLGPKSTVKSSASAARFGSKFMMRSAAVPRTGEHAA